MHNISMSGNAEAGSLLTAVLQAEGRIDQALRYPELSVYADAVIRVARRMEKPVLMAVGSDGQRLLGAVEIRGEGRCEQADSRVDVADRQVLLVAVAGVSAAGVSLMADQARRQGASEVHACAVDAALGDSCFLDSFTQLDLRGPRVNRRRSA